MILSYCSELTKFTLLNTRKYVICLLIEIVRAVMTVCAHNSIPIILIDTQTNIINGSFSVRLRRQAVLQD